MFFPAQASQSEQYRQRLARAAGLGFVSIPRPSRAYHIIKRSLARDYRKVKITYHKMGIATFRGRYGRHPVTRDFALNSDGTLPDNRIIHELHLTADRMDARGTGLRKKRCIKTLSEVNHPIYVHHGNEQPKLHELVKLFPLNTNFDGSNQTNNATPKSKMQLAIRRLNQCIPSAT